MTRKWVYFSRYKKLAVQFLDEAFSLVSSSVMVDLLFQMPNKTKVETVMNHR
jgi:hypothetical protein